MIYDVFHGTGNVESIYSAGFVYEYIGIGTEQYGPGFYFTDSLNTAISYTKKEYDGKLKLGGMSAPGVVKARVELCKPIQTDGGSESGVFYIFPSLNRLHSRRTIQLAVELGGIHVLDDWGDVEYEGRHAVITRAVEAYADKPSAYLMYDLFANRDIPQALRYITKATGYDGVVVDFGTEQWIVAWYPEQISIVKDYS